MSKLMIEGSHCLEGELTVHGAKNSALPVLSATLLCDGESHIHNCPRLSDVDASVEILRYLGCRVVREGDTVSVNTDTLCRFQRVGADIAQTGTGIFQNGQQ